MVEKSKSLHGTAYQEVSLGGRWRVSEVLPDKHGPEPGSLDPHQAG